MAIAKRTGDEDRIVRGGELPEDDGSLDNVVVSKPGENDSAPKQSPPVAPNPYQKEHDELWTSYLVRRLEEEGISMPDFGVYITELTAEIELNSGFTFGINRTVLTMDAGELDKIVKELMPGYSSKTAYQQDFAVNLLLEESFSFLRDSPEAFLRGVFNGGNVVLGGNEEEQATEVLTSMGLGKKYKIDTAYPARQVIEDFVGYIKEIGVKQNDNS